ncbi:hypothetical protein UFOVP61_33 [uncultured Caudovirales phage]|uniref:Uncharacterized protein n=1 Tax=uncultured Caudovirales phage TaxID=2100421 RepID=A0A6J5KXS4_9CAUD|nr:hypothetical protein UFOVP61_33 [uncultured Caudovirales phage]
MSDNLDIASEREELARSVALTNRKPEGPAATGECLYCGRGFLNLRLRWCDAECRDAWSGLDNRRK